MMVAQLCKFTKSHWKVHLKRLSFMICKSCFSKAVFFNHLLIWGEYLFNKGEGHHFLKYASACEFQLLRFLLGVSCKHFKSVPFSLLCSFSVVSFVIPWTVALQAPLSMRFSRQEYWSGLTFPPPGHLTDPGIEPASLASSALAGEFFTTEPPGKPKIQLSRLLNTIQVSIFILFRYFDIITVSPVRDCMLL